jgi:hypothetical protein
MQRLEAKSAPHTQSDLVLKNRLIEITVCITTTVQLHSSTLTRQSTSVLHLILALQITTVEGFSIQEFSLVKTQVRRPLGTRRDAP